MRAANGSGSPSASQVRLEGPLEAPFAQPSPRHATARLPRCMARPASHRPRLPSTQSLTALRMGAACSAGPPDCGAAPRPQVSAGASLPAASGANHRRSQGNARESGPGAPAAASQAARRRGEEAGAAVYTPLGERLGRCEQRSAQPAPDALPACHGSPPSPHQAAIRCQPQGAQLRHRVAAARGRATRPAAVHHPARRAA
jgi:hypothetical protein